MARRQTKEKGNGMAMTMWSRRALTGVAFAFALATGSALAASGLRFDPTITVSTSDAAPDDVLLSRYLFGVRGAALVESAVGNGASRNNSTVIEAHLQGLCVTSPTQNQNLRP